MTVRDCERRGPGPNRPVDNEYFRDAIRARSLENRKPNDVVVHVEGQYARLSRAGGAIRSANRHGQLWSVDDIVSASSQSLRRQLNAAPGRLRRLCRNNVCGQNEEALHIKAYAGIPHHCDLRIHGEQYSPAALCCTMGARLRNHLRKGLCSSGCCRRRAQPPRPGVCCCSRRRPRAPHLDGAARRPDSDSEIKEMGGCEAECLAWVRPGADSATFLSRGRCPDAAMSDLTPLLHQDLATSDVKGFPGDRGHSLRTAVPGPFQPIPGCEADSVLLCGGVPGGVA